MGTVSWIPDPTFDPPEEILDLMGSVNNLATSLLTYGNFADITPGSLITEVSGTSAEIDDIVFPTTINGFGEGSVSFANAIASFTEYVNAIPTTPTAPTIAETTTATPTLDTDPGLSTVTVPEFTDVSPTLDFGTAPVFEDEAEPTEPTLTTVTAPTSPTLTYPSVPTLSDVVIPDVISLTIPTFSASFNAADLTAPTNTFTYTETDYSSALKDAIYNKLVTEIGSGDYGLDSNDETALFNRERDKESYNAQLAYEEVKRNYAVTGFTVPTGALNKALERATLESLRKNSSVNRDIYLKRADLYWEGKKFVITSGINLEQILIGLHNAKWERALNAAKATVELTVAIFNAQVAYYNAQVAKYRVEAEVFDAQVRGEIAKVELYKAQMEGAKVQVEIGKNQVELYTAQVEGLKNLVDVYKAQVESANMLLTQERIKMEIYRAEVEAYTAKIGAQKYKFDAYTARVQGELGKAQAYEAQARAYAARVEGAKANVEVQRLNLQSWIEQNKSLIDVYQISVKEAEELRNLRSKVFENEVLAFRANMEEFSSKVQGLSRIYDLGQAALERDYRLEIATFQQYIENARVQLQRLLGIIDAETKLTTVATERNARIKASALNIINMNAGLSWHYGQSESYSQSNSASDSYGYSNTVSNSTGIATHYNHNYNYGA